MKQISESQKAPIEYLDKNLAKKDDIIIPETMWGELVYLYFTFKDMFQTRKDIPNKYRILKRQFRFFKRWQYLKYHIKVKEFRPHVNL